MSEPAFRFLRAYHAERQVVNTHHAAPIWSLTTSAPATTHEKTPIIERPVKKEHHATQRIAGRTRIRNAESQANQHGQGDAPLVLHIPRPATARAPTTDPIPTSRGQGIGVGALMKYGGRKNGRNVRIGIERPSCRTPE